VAAQALARAGILLGDPSLTVAAGRAYAAIPGKLDLELSSGPWIRLYGFDHEIVLNAQLQAILSLREYGQTAGMPDAIALATRMTAAARALFPRFDTGDWSLYELGGGYAKTSYQEFVTSLLGRLAKQTQDPYWQAAAARFVAYTYDAPRVTQADQASPLVIYPQPADGWLDTAAIPVVLSKRASLTLAVAGTVLTWSNLSRGAHTLVWTPAATVQPGTYSVQVQARDFNGRRATFQLAPVTVAWDTAPPQITATVAGTTLTWTAADPGTPGLELELDLSDPAGVQPPQQLDLGEQATSGTLALPVPPGTWNAALVATNSAGLTTTVPLPVLVVAQPTVSDHEPLVTTLNR
jgi:hypothetical protein